MDVNDLDDILSMDDEFDNIEKEKEKEKLKKKTEVKTETNLKAKTEKKEIKKEEEEKPAFPSYKKIENFLTFSGNYFSKDMYKKIVSHDKEFNTSIHKNLSMFLKTTDKEEKMTYRIRFISAFWMFYNKFVMLFPKYSKDLFFKIFLRYSVLSPSLVDVELLKTLNTLNLKNNTGEKVYYIDEWLEKVSKGEIPPSLSDEVATKKKTNAIDISKEKEKLTTLNEDIKSELELANTCSMDIKNTFQLAINNLKYLLRSTVYKEEPLVFAPFNSNERTKLQEINSFLRKVDSFERNLTKHIKLYESLELKKLKLIEIIEKTGEKINNSSEGNSLDTKLLQEELKTVIQMTKLCIGRSGNTFPVLTKQFFRSGFMNLGIREHVINILVEIEKYDPTLFHKEFKNNLKRIEPYVILTPCYGESGTCWQAFERGKKETSPARICIPMYSKDLRKSVMMGIASFRWQMAKERAGQYWMSTGLTGWYYDEITKLKLKGDNKITLCRTLHFMDHKRIKWNSKIN